MHREFRVTVWVVMTMMLLGWLAACGAAVPPVPSKGGPAWAELTSEHFTLWTDATPERAHELIREMERFRQIVVGVAFPGAPSTARVLVIALRDDDELSEFMPTHQARAYATSAHSPLWQPMMVLSAFSNRDPSDLSVAHELTHVISFSVIHHQPRWLAEGMAKFFETVRLDPDSTTADIGVAPQTLHGGPQQMAHLVPTAKLFSWKAISEHEDREYSTAWALFTFLINQHRNELAHYMQLLDSDDEAELTVTPERIAHVWAEALPSLPPSQADIDMRQWLVSGSHVVVHLNVQLRDWSVTTRALNDADAYAARGLLRATVTGQTAQARADLAAALAIDPTHVLARLVTTALDEKPMTVADAHALTAAHADDWRAWLLTLQALASVHGEQEDILAARAKTCELAAKNPALLLPPKLCTARATTNPSP
jgi:hypothetical protein